jgi:drug/metabolite transporter (DMT)-like permease
MRNNFLTELRDCYAGPWPRALFYLLLVAIAGPLVGFLITGEPLAPRMFVGSSLLALALFAIGIRVKRVYPRSDNQP